ncbi:MAG: hypothetical protein CSA47_01400 [Gammaproteobacteria bacterium]|nr:MAG: hypothetical protein CSA47_01400 [Gammaproteobacteria bacterium]
MSTTLKTNKLIIRFGYFVAVLTLLSIFILARATEGSETFQKLYLSLLITTLSGICSLFVIVLYFIYKTIKYYYLKVPGTSLSLTILSRTLLLAFIPLLFLSYFSFKFLHYEFQSSFDKGINDALTSSLTLSQKALSMRGLQALKDTQIVADIIAPFEYIALQRNLERIRKNIDAGELTVFDEKGFIQAFASIDKNTIIPLIPEHSDFIRVENRGGLFVVDRENNNFAIRVLTNINKPGAPNYYLQAVYQIPDTMSQLMQQVNKTVTERDKFNYLMPKVNSSFIFLLILVLLLGSLLLILSSFSFANDMARPIHDLIHGTKKVSQGNFDQQVFVQRQDDFGTLINSFNQMTRSLKEATEESEINRNKLESQRSYLETVINHMTAAVLTLDYQCRLLTFNESAKLLLNCQLDKVVNVDLQHIDESQVVYKTFIEQLGIDNINETSPEIEIKIDIGENVQQFVARVTPLPSTDKLHGGYVIIFYDMRQYLQQQKQAAWEEVARRLAHEIKNPLTPILLAAERLNYKLAGHLQEKEQKVLKRSIDVISNQVKSLKNMVDDFSHFAKPISLDKSNLSVHHLLKDIFELYKEHFLKTDFELSLTAKKDHILGNANSLRQVFHNLIKNAIEATEKQPIGRIEITTINEKNNLIVSISDNGIGLFDNHDVFEPYVTSKEKGTGLGLAIVKKIIQEHHGKIALNNRSDGSGVIVRLVLPLIKENE